MSESASTPTSPRLQLGEDVNAQDQPRDFIDTNQPLFYLCQPELVALIF